LVGTITFENLTASDCDGALQWFKPAQPSGIYQSGFDISINLMGSRYGVVKNTQVLDFTNTTLGNATISLNLGNLSAAITNDLTVSNLNLVSVTGGSSNNLSLKLTSTSGIFRGKFAANPLKPTSLTAFGGVVYQKLDIGGGLFVGPSQTGCVTLNPE
jgi:hypothetical protein